MHARILLLSALLIAACSSASSNGSNAPQSPTASRDDTLSIGLGKEVSTSDRGLTITFVRKVAESRCALNVVCVWQGDAAVRLRAESRTGTTLEATIHTTLDPKSFEAGGYQVSLLDVQPYPGSSDSARSPSVVVRVIRGE